MFSVIEFVRFNFSAEEEVAAISEKVPDHKTIARLQLADAKDVLEGIQDVKGVSFPILTPNLKVRYICFKNYYCHHSKLYNQPELRQAYVYLLDFLTVTFHLLNYVLTGEKLKIKICPCCLNLLLVH
ncbi:uncharacterized protein DS421_2g51320 [Arachis hypogaea]|nr:uncharacterized protein DS421_2g51320 [Arachis hypogaea]